ncbi:hypothetical protein FA95DRAFT_1560172 [Auriscalpium vulgare]|uniref:Uncharacterized protein n=1 Tax=Auriscalpium vulgare TaxID=40419 RepID=A0ACB8RQV5_9AGAM|nr:hypothetical protein FA95DRAFT_1560172 [Auriscalpium vulgare]
MDTDHLDTAMSQYAIAAIILDDKIPSWKHDLNEIQRFYIAQVSNHGYACAGHDIVL